MRRTLTIAFLGLVILAGGVRSTAAQTGTPIRYGDTVTGTITAEVACRAYWFEGRAGDAITIGMTRASGTLDGNLTLRLRDDLDAEPVATNDDRSAGSFDPLIETTLPATDWYTLAACRLESNMLSPTTGDFILTLSGPSNPTATPTPQTTLSDSVFGSAEDTTSLPQSAPDPLADGSVVIGRLERDALEISYPLPVEAGWRVTVEWQQEFAMLTPQLIAANPAGEVIASAWASEPARELGLTFVAPATETIALAVARFPYVATEPAGDFSLSVAIMKNTDASADSMPDAETPNPFATACQSDANTPLTDGIHLQAIRMAAGDSFEPDELTPTDTFAPDDDLNIIFEVEGLALPTTVTALFCGPDGNLVEFDERRVTDGGPYLLGLDWESVGETWATGDWFAELYVEGTLEAVLHFAVG